MQIKAIFNNIIIFLSTALYALGVNVFLIPHKVVGGALTGVCEIIYFATDFPIFLSEAIANAILLICAFFTIGLNFCGKTIVGIAGIVFWLYIIPISETQVIQNDFLNILVSGIICGTSLGCIFKAGGSTGGTDIIAKIVNKYSDINLGSILFFTDLFIITSFLWFPDGSLYKLFCGLLMSLICSTIIYIFTKK